MRAATPVLIQTPPVHRRRQLGSRTRVDIARFLPATWRVTPAQCWRVPTWSRPPRRGTGSAHECGRELLRQRRARAFVRFRSTAVAAQFAAQYLEVFHSPLVAWVVLEQAMA